MPKCKHNPLSPSLDLTWEHKNECEQGRGLPSYCRWQHRVTPLLILFPILTFISDPITSPGSGLLAVFSCSIPCVQADSISCHSAAISPLGDSAAPGCHFSCWLLWSYFLPSQKCCYILGYLLIGKDRETLPLSFLPISPPSYYSVQHAHYKMQPFFLTNVDCSLIISHLVLFLLSPHLLLIHLLVTYLLVYVVYKISTKPSVQFSRLFL